MPPDLSLALHAIDGMSLHLPTTVAIIKAFRALVPSSEFPAGAWELLRLLGSLELSEGEVVAPVDRGSARPVVNRGTEFGDAPPFVLF